MVADAWWLINKPYWLVTAHVDYEVGSDEHNHQTWVSVHSKYSKHWIGKHRKRRPGFWPTAAIFQVFLQNSLMIDAFMVFLILGPLDWNGSQTQVEGDSNPNVASSLGLLSFLTCGVTLVALLTSEQWVVPVLLAVLVVYDCLYAWKLVGGGYIPNFAPTNWDYDYQSVDVCERN